MLNGTINHVLGLLTSSALSAASDPRDLNVPGVWVTPDTVAFDRLSLDSATVTLTIVVIAQGVGLPDDALTLDALMRQTTAVLGPLTWETDAVTLPNHSPDPLPAMRANINFDWSA